MSIRLRSALLFASLAGAACVGFAATPARALPGPNLVSNGGFENPVVSIFAILSSIPGWTTPNGIEIQTSALYTPQQGNQYAELDLPPTVSISQNLTVTPGVLSEFSFYYSPRPGVPAASNALNVKLDGNSIFSLADDGTSLSNTNWTLYSYLYTPTTSSAAISFTATGPSISAGVYLDNVSYTQVPGPLAVMGPVVALGSCRRLRRLSTSLRLLQG